MKKSQTLSLDGLASATEHILMLLSLFTLKSYATWVSKAKLN